MTYILNKILQGKTVFIIVLQVRWFKKVWASALLESTCKGNLKQRTCSTYSVVTSTIYLCVLVPGPWRSHKCLAWRGAQTICIIYKIQPISTLRHLCQCNHTSGSKVRQVQNRVSRAEFGCDNAETIRSARQPCNQRDTRSSRIHATQYYVAQCDQPCVLQPAA